MKLTVPRHALLAHRMAALRDAATPPETFRRLLSEIGTILTVAATADLPSGIRDVATPMETVTHPVLAGPEPALVPILRAGLGLLEGARRVLPDAPVGHIGLVRDEHTLQPAEYLRRLPPDAAVRGVLLLDPMLATGGSAIAACTLLKSAGITTIRMVVVVAAPEGVAAMQAAHPDVPIWAGALDRGLNAQGFILPGLGDAGDRCFGTEPG